MSAIITHIECAGPELKARRLVFNDESDRLTSAAAVRTLGLEEGSTLSKAEVEERLDEVEPDLAKNRALRLLGYRERSIAEVKRKLATSGYPRRVVDAVVSRLVDLGLVDDARFAAMWSRSRASAGYGRRRVARELADKGVPSETATKALDEAFGDDDQVARARALLRGAKPTTRAERDRLLRRLVSRGFDLSTALAALGSADEAVTGE